MALQEKHFEEERNHFKKFSGLKNEINKKQGK